jgi:hypothetical protein
VLPIPLDPAATRSGFVLLRVGMRSLRRTLAGAIGKMSQELTTTEVATLIGVAPDLLRKWKARGFLPHAPAGVSGQGRGVQCMWSADAIEEARYVAATQQKTKRRTRG